jgi:hypothetical protein
MKKIFGKFRFFLLFFCVFFLSCQSNKIKETKPQTEEKNRTLTVGEFINKYKETPDKLKEFDKQFITIEGFDSGRGIKPEEESTLFLKADAKSADYAEWISCIIAKEDTTTLGGFKISRDKANKFTVSGIFSLYSKDLQSSGKLIAGKIQPCQIIKVEEVPNQ